MPVMTVAHGQSDTANVNLVRSVAVPDELVPEPGDSCRYRPSWHDTPLDSIRVRRWRNQLTLPYQARTSLVPLHIDPGLCRQVG